MGKIAKPNYKKIFHDVLELKYPEKKEACKTVLSKETLSVLDVININKIIFEKKLSVSDSSMFKAYDKSFIFEILTYQKKNKLNNTQLASHFKLSRNTIAKWKKMFL